MKVLCTAFVAVCLLSQSWAEMSIVEGRKRLLYCTLYLGPSRRGGGFLRFVRFWFLFSFSIKTLRLGKFTIL